MFGAKHRSKTSDGDDAPAESRLLSELGPEIQAVADRLAALSLPELAAEVMSTSFKAEYELNARVWGLLAQVGDYLPPHRTGDFREPDEATPAECQLRELVAEGLQLLERACLIMHSAHSYMSPNGLHEQEYTEGYATTRLGRTALANGTVAQLVASVLPGT